MRKRIKKVTAVLFSTLLLSGCAVKKQDEEAVTLMVGTDIHYLSPSLHDNGELFRMMMQGGDGKMTEYSEQTADAFVEKALEIRPEAVILSGDLTFNGELQSLLDLKEKLLKITEEGIPVCVIPGNHDIAYPMARKYEGFAAFETENISGRQFREIMGCFGYDRAVSKDEASFSYLYELKDGVYLVYLDADTEESPGMVRTETLLWLDEALEMTERSLVVCVTHENLLPQSPMMAEGFMIQNHDVVLKILKKHNVQVNFSGHSHIQHASSADGFTDICTGSMSVAPMRYGAVYIKGSEVNYSKQTLGVLQEESETRFRQLTETQVSDSLETAGIPEDIRGKMVRFAGDINLAYFAGDLLKEDITGREEWEYWEQYGSDTFWYVYFRSMTGG